MAKSSSDDNLRDKEKPVTVDRMKQVLREHGLDENLTTRGTPRVYNKPRRSTEVDGDPRAEKNRMTVKPVGRVNREIAERFAAVAREKFAGSSEALKVAIEEFLEKYEP